MSPPAGPAASAVASGDSVRRIQAGTPSVASARLRRAAKRWLKRIV
jgi:hypothetical protein